MEFLWSYFIHTNEINVKWPKHHLWFGSNPSKYDIHVQTFAFLKSGFFNTLNVTLQATVVIECGFYLSSTQLTSGLFKILPLPEFSRRKSQLRAWSNRFFAATVFPLPLSSLSRLLHPPELWFTRCLKILRVVYFTFSSNVYCIIYFWNKNNVLINNIYCLSHRNLQQRRFALFPVWLCQLMHHLM